MHDHAERIAHEDQVDACFVEQAGGGIVVGGEDGDFLTELLSLAEFGEV